MGNAESLVWSPFTERYLYVSDVELALSLGYVDATGDLFAEREWLAQEEGDDVEDR